MTSSFDYIIEVFPEMEELAEKGKYVEKCLYTDNKPGTCMREIRTYAETLAKELIACNDLQFSEEGTQLDRTRLLKSRKIIPNSIFSDFQTIRKQGNDAIHDEYGDVYYAGMLVERFYDISIWYAGYCCGRAYEKRQYVKPQERENSFESHDVSSPSLAKANEHLPTAETPSNSAQPGSPKVTVIAQGSNKSSLQQPEKKECASPNTKKGTSKVRIGSKCYMNITARAYDDNKQLVLEGVLSIGKRALLPRNYIEIIGESVAEAMIGNRIEVEVQGADCKGMVIVKPVSLLEKTEDTSKIKRDKAALVPAKGKKKIIIVTGIGRTAAKDKTTKEEEKSKSPRLMQNHPVSVTSNDGEVGTHAENFYRAGCELLLLNDYDNGIKDIKQAAELGHIEANCKLGKLYYEGKHIAQNYHEALICFRKAAEKGSTEAAFYTGLIYSYALGVNADYIEAKKWYEEAASNHYNDAIREIGKLYYYGLGVEKNYIIALRYFQEAAENGDISAEYFVGDIYCYGRGVSCDYVEAQKRFVCAANSGDVRAIAELGKLYYFGRGVSKNRKTAIRYFLDAAGKGNDVVAVYIGKIYHYGYEVDTDYTEAKKWYEIAATSNNDSVIRDAKTGLGQLYYHGHGVTKNRKTALRYFLDAAGEGNAVAAVYIGQIYHYGYEVDTDYAEAKKWYEIAATGNSNSVIRVATRELGKLYYFGHGVDQNYKVSLSFFMPAALKGDHESEFYIGSIYYYFYGHGETAYYGEAKMWLERAAVGYSDAQELLEQMRHKKVPGQTRVSQRSKSQTKEVCRHRSLTETIQTPDGPKVVWHL